MQARHELSPSRINTDLLHFMLHTPGWFLPAVIVLGLVLAAAVVGEAFVIAYGLQLLGYTNNVYWSVLIVNFVFWVGISHAGVMISAILRLTHAEWRRPITRAAEVVAVFALITSSMFVLIHTGRVWRTWYWILPYDFTREMWPSIRSGLVWDPSAIMTYLTGTMLFVYVDLIPDLAVARDRARGVRQKLYSLLSMGFRGTTRQWRIQLVAGQLMSALILPVFISVHSIEAWDFAVVLLPGWHSTVFAPYFVIGAVHSGVAAVVVVMVILRRLFHLESYITRAHLDVVGRLQIVVALAYLFFFLMNFFFGLFGREPVSLRIWELRLLIPPTSWLFYIQVITTLLIPFPLWLVPRFRRSGFVMLAASISVNIGMFLERYLLVVTPLMFKQPFVFTWVTTYEPRFLEYLFTVASFALATLGLLLFARLFPIIPLWEVKEGQVTRRVLSVGRARVPATPRE